MRILKITLVALMSIAVCTTAVADNYFEDDIYYDASKAKKKKEKKVETTNTVTQPISYQNEVVYNYGNSMRDVDEYNRQGAYYSYAADTTANDSILNIDGYTYTNRIERFYNPEVVSGSGNQELIESYSVNQPIINVYVDDYWNPYPSISWSIGYPWYSWNYPYYYSAWNPYWSNWYYNPWSWSWGWSYPYYYPCYGPHHHHYYPSYYHHYYGGVRHAPSGAYRPHRSSSRPSGVSRPGYSRNSRGDFNSSFGSTRGRNRSVGSTTNNSRPDNMSEGRGGRRSNSAVDNGRPNNSSKRESVNSGNNNQRRGRNNSGVSNSSSRSSSNDNSSYSRPSNNSSRSNSSYSRPSGGSSRGSGFSGGSSRGGGGSRGRR